MLMRSPVVTRIYKLSGDLVGHLTNAGRRQALGQSHG
jgi:hypothetical protein